MPDPDKFAFLRKEVHDIPETGIDCTRKLTILLEGVCRMTAFSCCATTNDRIETLVASNSKSNELHDIILKGTQRYIMAAYALKEAKEQH